MAISNRRAHEAISDIERWTCDKLKQIDADLDVRSVDYIFDRDLYRITFSKKGALKFRIIELPEEWVVLEETRCEFVLGDAARKFLEELMK